MAEIATIEVFGPKGRLIINASDLNEWRGKGYSTERKPAEVEKPPIIPTEKASSKKEIKRPSRGRTPKRRM